MRIVLSLFLFLSALTLFATNGCSNTNFTNEEGKAMGDSVNPASGGNTEGYKTATFALG